MTRINNKLSGVRLVLSLIALLVLGVRPGWAQMTPAPDFHVMVPSAYGFDETLDGLRQGIEAENLMVIHEIDPQQMLRMVGVRTGGMRQIMFFHPRYMKEIIESNPNGAIEPPLKVVAMEMPDGTVMVRYIKPTYLFGRYGGLDSVGTELEAVLERVVASIKQ